MSGDRREYLVDHQIAKEAKMSIVDVQTIEFNNLLEFLHDCSSSGFNSKDCEFAINHFCTVELKAKEPWWLKVELLFHFLVRDSKE